MNWQLVLLFLVFLAFWFGMAAIFSALGFGKEDREIIEWDKKRNQ